MTANNIRTLACVKAELLGGWHYHAEHNDGRTRSFWAEDSRYSESYILDCLAREFRNDEVTV